MHLVGHGGHGGHRLDDHPPRGVERPLLYRRDPVAPRPPKCSVSNVLVRRILRRAWLCQRRILQRLPVCGIVSGLFILRLVQCWIELQQLYLEARKPSGCSTMEPEWRISAMLFKRILRLWPSVITGNASAATAIPTSAAVPTTSAASPRPHFARVSTDLPPRVDLWRFICSIKLLHAF